MKNELKKELKSKTKNELIYLLEQCLEQIKRSIDEIDRLRGITNKNGANDETNIE